MEATRGTVEAARRTREAGHRMDGAIRGTREAARRMDEAMDGTIHKMDGTVEAEHGLGVSICGTDAIDCGLGGKSARTAPRWRDARAVVGGGVSERWERRRNDGGGDGDRT